MIGFLKKMVLYTILIIVFLELLVRCFHLYNERPTRYVDEQGVQKWIPGQEGFSVYGNRRQLFVEYKINKSGFNSYHEFNPSTEKFEVALVGDSFIEGFHQYYKNSIGRKIEILCKDSLEVYEYGHSGNDLADHLYTMEAYDEEFDLIDFTIIGLEYENDLTRGEYELIRRQPVFPLLSYSKLYIYGQTIGIFDPLTAKLQKLKETISGNGNKKNVENSVDTFHSYLGNFKKLIASSNFNKDKTAFLLDIRTTDPRFLDFLEQNGFRYLDLSVSFENSKDKTDLIFDKHWNNHGRSLIAYLIVDYISELSSKNKKN